LRRLGASLKKLDKKRVRLAEAKIFPEGFRAYGIKGGKTQIAKFIAAAFHTYGQSLDFTSRLAIADELFQSRMYEECQAAILILHKEGKKFDQRTLKTFVKWIDHYVENWAVCDSLSIGLISQFFVNHPGQVVDLHAWAKSRNRWKRRAACVVLSKLCRKGEFLADVFRLADSLLSDSDKMVQKGVGWLLKEASRTKVNEVIDFLNRHQKRIPKLVRSYAMERMNSIQKARVLK